MAEDSVAPAAGSAVVGREYFAERLWPSVGIWVVGLALAGTAGVVFYPAAGVPGVLAALALSGLIVVALMLWWSARVRVVEVTAAGAAGRPWLQAGRARIPLSALGDARALAAAEWTTALGTGADARSYRFVRGWIATGIRVDVVDERDPVPSWLVSTRRPDALVAAIDRARTPGP